MRLLIDVNHPAHVHLFRNLSRVLEQRGNNVLWAARPRDVIEDLLVRYKCNYKMLTLPRKGYLNLAKELVKRDIRLFRLVGDFKPEIMVGTSVCITHVSKVAPAKSIVFNEDNLDLKKLSLICYPFADTICTPDCFQEHFGPKHIKYPSYHELAYLHPNRFQPDPKILKKLKVFKGKKYFILRFVSFSASHDAGEAGISLTLGKQLIEKLAPFGKIFITSERTLVPEFERYRISIAPHEIFDALYYATMCIGDSQTVIAEAAVLGTPAIRCNTYVGHQGKVPYLDELEDKYGLTYGFLPNDEDKMFDKIIELLNKPDLKEEWQKRRNRMLMDKIDLTDWMVNFVKNYSF